ncbi:unnamed protein product [Phytophthora lilii]|uniref:Unnamed protein product n=1 Tax=Phytophthora lilii TaxID=2077276 RepID=A0A9W6WP03_9STRA|nr:unnamed protein product [Phytophthora lilii]
MYPTDDDCKLEIVSKVSVVFQSAMSLATFGLYGEFKLMAKGVHTAFKCIAVGDAVPDGSVVFDLPVTICTCLGIKVAEKVKFADKVTNTAELVLKEVLANADTIVSGWDSFKTFMKEVTLGEPISALNQTNITSLQSAMKSNTTCGYDMKRLSDRTWTTVAAFRSENPEISEMICAWP